MEALPSVAVLRRCGARPRRAIIDLAPREQHRAVVGVIGGTCRPFACGTTSDHNEVGAAALTG